VKINLQNCWLLLQLADTAYKPQSKELYTRSMDEHLTPFNVSPWISQFISRKSRIKHSFEQLLVYTIKHAA